MWSLSALTSLGRASSSTTIPAQVSSSFSSSPSPSSSFFLSSLSSPPPPPWSSQTGTPAISKITTVIVLVQRCPGAAHLKQRYVTLAAPRLIEVGIMRTSSPHPSHRCETHAGHARCQPSNVCRPRRYYCCIGMWICVSCYSDALTSLDGLYGLTTMAVLLKKRKALNIILRAGKMKGTQGFPIKWFYSHISFWRIS